MTFAYTTDIRTRSGSMNIVIGTFTSSAAGTGGDIATGLNHVDFFDMQLKASSVSDSVPEVNNSPTMPGASGTITIITKANAVGFYIAKGK